jgi:hypothetical protein
MDDAERMVVEFEVTVEETVEVTRRAIARTRTARAVRLRSCLTVAALAGAGTYFMPVGDAEYRAIPAALAAAFGAVFAYLLDGWLIGRRTRAYIREMAGQRDSFPVRIAVMPDGVFTQSIGPDSLSRWENVTAVEVTEGGVDIWAGPLALVAVLRRGFGSDDEMERYVELVERYWKRPAVRVGAGGKP